MFVTEFYQSALSRANGSLGGYVFSRRDHNLIMLCISTRDDPTSEPEGQFYVGSSRERGAKRHANDVIAPLSTGGMDCSYTNWTTYIIRNCIIQCLWMSLRKVTMQSKNVLYPL